MFENYSKCLIWSFEFRHFPPIFVLWKVTCQVTLFGHSKCTLSSLNSQCWMRLFINFQTPLLLYKNAEFFVTFLQVINAILRLSHLLVCVNSSANFLIYYARGERFRRAWIETFGECWCRCCKNPASNTTTTVATTQVTTQDGHLRMNPLNGNSNGINGHTNHTMLEAQETRVTFV